MEKDGETPSMSGPSELALTWVSSLDPHNHRKPIILLVLLTAKAKKEAEHQVMWPVTQRSQR